MRISRVKLDHFRRFTDLEIRDVPDTVRLVILAGPNGMGKSSLFDAFALWHQMHGGFGWNSDDTYYAKGEDRRELRQRIDLNAHGDNAATQRKDSFYFRSAYRNDPEFALGGLNRVPPILETVRFQRMIETDAAVTQNYQRLASMALENVFTTGNGSMTLTEFRESIVGEIRDAMCRLFPGLTLMDLGNPLDRGTFRFAKGAAKNFNYKNLSGGEKAVFDLLLDLVVKRQTFSSSVYCIDEPEAHVNTRLHGPLLRELFDLTPPACQLWVATHSIGMLRFARELSEREPGLVAFLDFGDRDFDSPVVMTPSRPSRAFWERALHVALDDLSHLIAPREVIVCEGNPAGAVPGKNAEHDAAIYNTVFSDELPDVKFLAGGNAKDVAADRLGFVAALPAVASGISVRRLIDRDDHSPDDVKFLARQGITTLGRRHLEAYTYDDEVLTRLCEALGRSGDVAGVLSDKRQALSESSSRGNPADDVKSAAGTIYTKVKQRLGLTAVGNDQMAFGRSTLAPLIKPGMSVYAELKRDVFGA